MASAAPVIPSVMQAAFNSAAGKVEVGQQPVPAITDDQVLVKVHATSLNPVDWKIRDYNFLKMAFPFIMGYDVSGEVVALGKNVQEYKIGDLVYGSPALNQNGANAQYVALHPDTIAPKPAKLTHVQAASIPVAGCSSYEGVVLEAKISKGETIYIPGGAGGVGHLAVQFAKAQGARVISSASRESSLALLKQLGADVVFDYTKQNPVDAVKAATNGQGADVVYDCTYPKEWVTSVKTLKKGGRLAYLGIGAGPPAEGEAAELIKANNISVFLADLGRYSLANRAQARDRVHGMLVAMGKLADAGALKPHVDKVFKLHEIPEALEQLKKNAFVGKVAVSLE